MPHRPLRVPSVLEMVPSHDDRERHELVLGPLAGYGLEGDLSQWKMGFSFVVLDDLSTAERIELVPALREIWQALESGGAPLDVPYRSEASRHPRVLAVVSRARLAFIDSDDERARSKVHAPRRAIEVGFVRTADDAFWLRVWRGGTQLAAVTGSLYALFDAAALSEDEVEFVDRGRFIDRVLRAATGGLVSSAQIALAFHLTSIGSERDLDAWEAELDASSTDATLAREIVATLERASSLNEAMLPVYGPAHRTTLASLTLRAPDGAPDTLDAYVRIGDASELEIPAEDVWTVTGVEDDVIAAPPRIVGGAKRSGPARSKLAIAAVVAIVLVLLVLAIRR